MILHLKFWVFSTKTPLLAKRTIKKRTRSSPRVGVVLMSSTRSVKELAECVGGVCQGDSSILIHGVADLDGAGPLEISFCSPKIRGAARKTKAGALVVSPDAPKDLGRVQIRVANPSGAFSKIAALFAPPACPRLSVCTRQRLSPRAELGESVGIGPYAVIEEGAVIGDGTQVGAGAFVGRQVKVGANCVFHPRVYVGRDV